MKAKNKIPKTFFIFLIASGFIWLLITFSKEYSSRITYNINYSKIPQNKLLQEKPLKELTLAIKGTGFKILTSNINKKSITLDASKLTSRGNSKYYFLLRNQITSIKNQVPSGIEVLNIEIDTIYLNLGSLKSKKIALKPNLDLEFHIGYDLLNEIKITPDSVLVSGPENQIDTLRYLNLKELSLLDVKNDFTNTVDIEIPSSLSGLKLRLKKASISGEVDKFTEGSLTVPFTIKNVPDSINITTLSEKVNVKFVTALSNFNKISENSLKIECDYLATKEDNLNYLIPKLIFKPDYIKSYKIIPNKIDFLIRK